MADFEEDSVFTEGVRAFEATDPARFDVLNNTIKPLVDRTRYLHDKVDELKQFEVDLADPDKGAAMVGSGVVAVSSPSALASLPEGQRRTDLNYIVSESGTATVWAWLPGDHSRDVALDPSGNRVIAPSSAPTGASGVFVLRTANSQWDILLSEFPERSLYEHVRDTAICKSNFVHRQVTGINSHIVVGSLQRGRAVGYIFREDGDGLIRIYGGGEGPSTWYGEDIHPTNVSGHYNTPANDRPYFYTINEGMSFDLEFTGTGLIFYHNADNRGGIWQVQVDDNDPIIISTWADQTGTNYKQSMVAQGLENTSHVATFTFMGEDPDHPPEGGVPARGWFNMRTDTFPNFYTGRVTEVLGADFVNGEFNRLISQNSVIEFAIRGRPSGTDLSVDWCPMHGSVSGVSREVRYEIWVDGQMVGQSLLDIGLIPVTFTELVIVERYTAYSSGDTDGDAPMWNGSLTWRYKDGELAFSHSMKAIRDCDLLAGGYLFMFASHNGYATRALTGRGFEKAIEQHGVVVEYPLLPSNQYAFVDDTLGNAVAVRVGSTKSYMPPGTKVAAHKDAYFQERDNNVVKFYGMTFPVGSKLSAGDSFSVSWEMAMSVGGWSVL